MVAQDSTLDHALRTFEAAEANLAKLERLWGRISSKIPEGISFGGDPEYDDMCSAFEEVKRHLPAIDGRGVESSPWPLNAIAQARLDCVELGEIECTISTEDGISKPGGELAMYRLRLHRERRHLVRQAVQNLVPQIESTLKTIWEGRPAGRPGAHVPESELEALKEPITQIDTLLGSAVKRPTRWGDLQRHLSFGQYGDISDIIQHDWPNVKPALVESLYDDSDPVPVDVADLADLVRAKPRGQVTTRLQWEELDAESFERLIFALISNEQGYENPLWLTHTNAPDRGRDLSVERVFGDSLSGTRRERVILQCRHWREKSVSPADVATLMVQVGLWTPPPDVVVIATSGRFTSDAVAAIEGHNASDRRLRLEMWPESHLERLLAARPALIGSFGLR